MDTATALSTIQSAIGGANGLQAQFMGVGGAALTIGVAVFALTKGWSLVRRFVG